MKSPFKKNNVLAIFGGLLAVILLMFGWLTFALKDDSANNEKMSINNLQDLSVEQIKNFMFDGGKPSGVLSAISDQELKQMFLNQATEMMSKLTDEQKQAFVSNLLAEVSKSDSNINQE